MKLVRSYWSCCPNSGQVKFLGLASLVLALSGCWGSDAPKLGSVSGKVTLDGKPLPNALLEFQPQGGMGTYSSGMTDDDGEYYLIYSRTDNGAMLGTHSVSITTELMLKDAGNGQPGRAPELLSPKYNKKSELTAEVTAGSNEINFDLKSDGQPIAKNAN